MTDDDQSGGDRPPGGDRPSETAGDRGPFEPDPVGGADVWAGMSAGDLAAQYGAAGAGAADLSRAVEITAEMLGGEDVTTLLGLAGAMVPLGMRGIVADLLRDGHVEALVTTGANLTHDAIEAIGGHHHHGSAGPADHRSDERLGGRGREHDEDLREAGVDRIYNVYLPQEHFTDFEHHLRDAVFPELDRTVSIAEFTSALGEANARVNEAEGVDADAGIAAAAYEADVPVYCPAVADSVLGIQAWMRSQVSGFTLDALADMTDLNDLVHGAGSAGALVVGGGVPKNYVLQAMLVTPGAYDYAVQLTTDPEHTGGLSGATLDEARSWGKLEPSARNVTVVGDATITFPFLVAAARERIE